MEMEEGRRREENIIGTSSKNQFSARETFETLESLVESARGFCACMQMRGRGDLSHHGPLIIEVDLILYPAQVCAMDPVIGWKRKPAIDNRWGTGGEDTAAARLVLRM